MSKKLRGEEFLRISQKFVKTYVSDKPQTIGVLLVGSSAIGVSDKLTDIDLIAFTDEQSLKRRKEAGKGYNEEYCIEGVEVCVDWNTIETLKKSILAQRDDVYLQVLSNSKTLHDPLRILHKALSGLKPYSLEQKRRKVFKHYYWVRAKVEDVKKCVERSEYKAASILVYQALDHLTRLLFIFEGNYVPIEKWSFYEMRRLHIGQSYLSQIHQILCISRLEKEEPLSKTEIFETILQSIKDQMLRMGIPNEWLGEEWWKYEPEWNA